MTCRWVFNTTPFSGLFAQSLQPCLILCDPMDWSHLSTGFSRQEYWSGLPCPPPGYLLDPGIEPVSLASPGSQADPLPTEPLGEPRYWNKGIHSGFW